MAWTTAITFIAYVLIAGVLVAAMTKRSGWQQAARVAAALQTSGFVAGVVLLWELIKWLVYSTRITIMWV